MEYVTRVINEQEKNKLIDFYRDKQIANNSEYIIFAAQMEKMKVYIYESKKGYKVSFQGEHALNEAKIFFQDVEIKAPKEKVKTEFIDYQSQIGSDEVGTGDLFGPLVVTACYFDEHVLDAFQNFKIDDSKKLTDNKIIEFCSTFLPHLIFSKFTLMPEKYNALINKGYSMNAIKAILHNKALKSLSKKVKYNNIYVDEFCSPSLYYNYLISANEEILDGINFHTKGESHYPSVALASMISRYSFLKSMEEMSKEYNLEFPKGASKKCDEVLKEFITLYGKEKLNLVAKMNFKNVKELEE